MSPARAALARLWSRGEVRYLLVGGFCFLADVAILWVAHDLLGVPLPIATPVAFLASFAFTYTMQRVIAFGSQSAIGSSVFRYTLLVVFNTVATTGIVWAAPALGLPWIVGKLVAVIATTIWNYFAYRHFVFRPARPARDADADA
ncbi:GtrA family protein [Microbacterium sp. SA39]|uniref:GtrA family protein n=1 Tax=Microbacterium sp. SA39 TaxID=1263625 RepID=UPI00061E37C2|nr:GtrA family protein [Microbacterium sp. SA39]KJQ53665.1 GtrA-like protein [Microbacterium sp. SA39]